MSNNSTLTAIRGLQVGHAQDDEALTGCTVILCEAGATGGVDQRGGAPGTRETDALRPMHLVEQVHAVVLAGGSAFGLDAASGVVRYLEERGVGYDVGVARVPVVPAAILFDLALGRADVRPGQAMGYQACQNATSGPVQEGCVGAGTGASVGKILGMGQAMKAGLGSAAIHLTSDLVVAALVAVNALGDVINDTEGEIIAGVRGAEPGTFAGTLNIMQQMAGTPPAGFAAASNTVIGVVATNARLNKEQVNQMAQMAHDGLARTICPAHTLFDGDTIFGLATGDIQADANVIGAFAAQVFAVAVVRAVTTAEARGGLPAAGDWKR